MPFGTVIQSRFGGFFIVQNENNNYAAFESADSANLNIGDVIDACFNKVGWTVVRHVERNETFEVFAHTGKCAFTTCLQLIETLSDLTEKQEIFENRPSVDLTKCTGW
jgi:hypothetical protein